jgi:hypothetical protein
MPRVRGSAAGRAGLWALAMCVVACQVVLGDFDDDGGAGGATGTSHHASSSAGGGTITSTTSTGPSTSSSASSSGSGGGNTNGEVCNGDGACESGHCIDGRCCALACTDQGASSCRATGVCNDDGSGCQVYPVGTVCGGDGSCSGSTITGASTCDASGTCVVANGPTACPNNLRCKDSTQCYASCDASGDNCIAGTDGFAYTCGETPATMAACLLPSGAPCSTPAECSWGICNLSTCD